RAGFAEGGLGLGGVGHDFDGDVWLHGVLVEEVVFEEGVAFIAGLGGGVLAHKEGEVNGWDFPENLLEGVGVGAGGPFGNGEEEAIAG
ncbi:MAG: hypothetical protein ACI4W7_03830, partial [Candidatus Spyradenecus sp.]